jgi:hypothetical protein
MRVELPHIGASNRSDGRSDESLAPSRLGSNQVNRHALSTVTIEQPLPHYRVHVATGRSGAPPPAGNGQDHYPEHHQRSKHPARQDGYDDRIPEKRVFHHQLEAEYAHWVEVEPQLADGNRRPVSGVDRDQHVPRQHQEPDEKDAQAN